MSEQRPLERSTSEDEHEAIQPGEAGWLLAAFPESGVPRDERGFVVTRAGSIDRSFRGPSGYEHFELGVGRNLGASDTF